MTSLASTARRQGAPAASSPGADRRRLEGSVEIAEVWLILWHRRLMILATAAILTLGAALYGLFTPALFTAASQILIDPRDRNVVSNDVNPSALSPDGGIAQVESQASVMQSTGVLMRAVRQARLTEDPEFAGRGFLATLLGLTEKQTPATANTLTPAESRALENLRRRIAVKRADKLLVLDVIATTRSPEQSALIANTIAEAYLADQAEARSQSAREASASITARLAEQRRRVEEAENAVERYRVQNNLVTSSGRLITDQQLGEISTQFAATQARVANLRAQVEQLRSRRDGMMEGSSTEAAQSAVIAKLREQEGVLIQREADLQTQLGPLHPAIVAARNQLSNTRRQIATEIRRVEQTVRGELDRAIGNEKELSTRLEVLTRQNQGSDQAAVRLRDLQRDLDAARSVYGNFLLRAQETREQAALDATNARIISRAQPPARKSWPPLSALLAGAGFIGLGLGAGIALIREYAAPHILSVSQAENLLDAPVFAVFGRGAKPARSWFRRSEQPVDASESDTAALALLNLFGRSYDQRRPPDSLTFIAPGASTVSRTRVARAIAEAAADRGDSVLFVDCVTAPEGESEQPGLLDLLQGRCSFSDAVTYDGVGDIATMHRGGVAESLQSNRQRGAPRSSAARFLADAGREFDLVVIDAGDITRNTAIGPLLGVVDHVVMVGEFYVTPQSEAAALAETADIMGGGVTGTILVERRGR